MKHTGKWYTGLLLLLCSTALFAQPVSYKTLPSGLHYHYFSDSQQGEATGVDGYLKMHIVMQKSDSVLINTYTEDRPAELLVREPTHSGCINEGFALLQAGDSAIYKVRADSLYTKTFAITLPPFVKADDELLVIVKVLESLTAKEFEEKTEREKMAADSITSVQMGQDVEELEGYAEKKGLKSQLEYLPSGVMYAIIKSTTGSMPKKGDEVAVIYNGYYTNGETFDGNEGREPYKVIIGEGGVIQGWLEVLDKMRKGEKWTVFIPSALGYGSEGANTFPPNTPMIFDMEVVDIKPAAQLKREKEELEAELKTKERLAISNFILKQKYKNLKKTKEGIHYVVKKEGVGRVPAGADSVSFKISAYQLDGTKVELVEGPISSPLNYETLPQALFQTISLMKEGSVFTVITPSEKFLGIDGGGRFEPYTPVRLEVELVNVIPAK